jgi:P-type Cu2+ transporter
MAIDPVCGMEVDEKSTRHVSAFNGKTYYFCSESDKAKFEAHPETYKAHSAPLGATTLLEEHVHPHAHEHQQQQAVEVSPPRGHAHHYTAPVGPPKPMGGHEMHGEAHAEHKGNHSRHEGHSVEGFRKRFWVSLIFTVPVLILSPMLQHWTGIGETLRFTGDIYLLFAFSSFIFFYGGYPFLKGLLNELSDRRPGMMTLIAVAISTAYVYSSAVVFGLKGEVFFWETATLIDIMLLGHWIEMKSVLGASRALEELAKLMPSDAHKLTADGTVIDVPLGELASGDRVLVKPGEKISADGDVVRGESSVNESMLTGESTPVHKKEGTKVIGGAINGEGSLTVQVTRTGKETFLSQVIDLVRQAQESKSRSQDLADRAALWLTALALIGGAVTLFVWLLNMNESFAFALERTVTVMVIACPHALGLAIPLVVAVSTALSAGHGLLIRNRNAFEQARNVQAIIFDKTGTLTQGKFGVTDIRRFGVGLTDQQLLQFAGAVEGHSEHPIAQGIVRSAGSVEAVDEFMAIPGKGAQGKVQGRLVQVVSPGFLRENNLKASEDGVAELSEQGKTVVYVVIDGKVSGAIALADIIRPESKNAIATLKQMGIHPMMLTGDNKRVAKWVSDELGLDEYFAEVLPDQKAQKVKEVQSRGLMVAMTGDGVNDAPALAQADVGIAIGAGTDVAVETADIVLVRSNPEDVVNMILLARATYRKMVQNLAWATGYNAIAMPLAAGVLYSFGILLSPAVGAVLMSLSTVIVAINAKLLKSPRSGFSLPPP